MITKGFSLAFALLISASFAQGIVASKETEESKTEITYSPIATATVKQDNVNVRGQASFKGEVVTKLRKGDTVTILEEITLKKPAKDEPTNWFRISLPASSTVWVFSEFVDASSNKVLPNRLNFRGGPGENFSILGRLKKGDVVKSTSTKGEWLQIEAPATAYAFVAAQLLEKETAVEPAPTPATAPEIVAAPEPEPAEPIAPEPAPAIAVDEPAPAIVSEPIPALVSPPPAPAEEALAKRIVRREGTVRRARNIQAPTYFELESWDSGKVINYLHSPEEQQIDPASKKPKTVPLIDLEPYIGRRVIVTGEEFMDRRWRNIPVIELEAIDLEQ